MNTPVPTYDERMFPLMQELLSVTAEIPRITSGLHVDAEQRQLFMDNELENPILEYDQKRLEVVVPQATIDTLQKEVDSSETHAVVAELYNKKMHHRSMRVQLLKAAALHDDTAFLEASTELYGVPQKKHYSYVVKRVLQQCDSCEKSHSGQVRRLRRVLSKSTGDCPFDPDVLPDPVPGKPLTSLAEVQTIFKETLDRLDLKGWTLEQRTDDRSNFAVCPYSHKVEIPKEEKLLTRRGLSDINMRAVAEHEIGVHALRNIQGSKQPLRLLQVGLHDYLRGEEGVATYVQQQVEGAKEFYGFDRYLAACLAVGMDGNPRDFRGVYSLMVDYYSLQYSNPDESIEEIRNIAWQITIRLFRGTTGRTPGCIYTKDIVYMEGNIGVWDLLIEQPQVFDALFIGKFNPLLTHHVTALQTLGIINEW